VSGLLPNDPFVVPVQNGQLLNDIGFTVSRHGGGMGAPAGDEADAVENGRSLGLWDWKLCA
jgi:hypothetical protein